MRRFFNRKSQRGFTLHELLIVIFALVVLGLAIGGLWVLVHFAAKFW
jgi:prepilin-type N-terminal cleavage/methylation domain-containing protein